MPDRPDTLPVPPPRLVQADCLTLLPTLPSACLDLIYLDPPYFTRRQFEGQDRRAAHPPAEPSDRAQPQESQPLSVALSFDDRWPSRAAYLAFLEARLALMPRLLKPGGAFLLHLDWHVVHYAKVLCDQLLGEENFQNEIVWYYQTGGASKGRFSRKHDTILFYSRGPEFYFDGRSIAIPRTPKALHRARNPKGARIAATDTHKNPDDVLTIPALNPMARERTGYPTQKPLQLLETLILALCPPGGTVGDFFCGSGTTLVAATRLGRAALGCDPNPAAIRLCEERLAAEVRKSESDAVAVPDLA